MKYFRGTFPEIKGISADNFQNENLNSSVFFLSHVHYDHTPGLEAKTFKNKLLEPNVYVYSSRISTQILKTWLPDSADKFIYIDGPRMIEIPGENSILKVVPIPAEHCPGSVMFLFMSKGKTILYTGDFRYELDVLEKYKKYFLTESGEVRKIDRIYLDATFFKKQYASFPSREVGLQKICELILEWIEIHKDHSALIKTPAYYGSEFLYLGIWKKLKIPMNVSPKIHNELLRFMPDFEGAITSNRETQIMARFKHEIFRNSDPNILVIIPSAFHWVDWDGSMIAEEVENGEIRVCYSCHSSYEEIVEFLKFLKPKSIEPNVLHGSEEDQERMYDLIEECIQDYTGSSSGSEYEEEIQSDSAERNPKRRRFQMKPKSNF